MDTKALLKRLDFADKKLGRSMFHINELRLLFKDESKESIALALNRHVKAGLITRMCRSIYYNHLCANKPANVLFDFAKKLRDYRDFYLSLEYVLSEEGIISQIPFRYTFISKSRSEVFDTPFGVLEFTKGKYDFDELVIDKEIYLSSEGIYVATGERAKKDAYRHKRAVDLIIEQEEKDRYYGFA